MLVLKWILVVVLSLIGNEKKYVEQCFDLMWILLVGEFIGKFEQSFVDFCGVCYVVVINNGIIVIYLVLVVLGIGEGDEVLILILIYIVIVNVVVYCNVKLVLVDFEFGMMNMDLVQLEVRIILCIKVIIVVYLYGYLIDMGLVMELVCKYNFKVIEDVVEVYGVEYNGKCVGGIGDCVIFSFFGNKIVIIGEGGMVIIDDDELVVCLCLYCGQGMDLKCCYWFLVVGFNYCMINIVVVIGLVQMECIDDVLVVCQKVVGWYEQVLVVYVDIIECLVVVDYVYYVYWMYIVLLIGLIDVQCDEVMCLMDVDGIEICLVFYLMYVLLLYLEDGSCYLVVNDQVVCGINLLMYVQLEVEDIECVVVLLVLVL